MMAACPQVRRALHTGDGAGARRPSARPAAVHRGGRQGPGPPRHGLLCAPLIPTAAAEGSALRCRGALACLIKSHQRWPSAVSHTDCSVS